ncbi:hypothetical protein NMY22_g4390 [Coprinellus aureogranulatus]|nr:hypothetical protein NMY22_g4390 [Coprinellus aureogranulatus]
MGVFDQSSTNIQICLVSALEPSELLEFESAPFLFPRIALSFERSSPIKMAPRPSKRKANDDVIPNRPIRETKRQKDLREKKEEKEAKKKVTGGSKSTENADKVEDDRDTAGRQAPVDHRETHGAVEPQTQDVNPEKKRRRKGDLRELELELLELEKQDPIGTGKRRRTPLPAKGNPHTIGSSTDAVEHPEADESFGPSVQLKVASWDSSDSEEELSGDSSNAPSTIPASQLETPGQYVKTGRRAEMLKAVGGVPKFTFIPKTPRDKGLHSPSRG